MPWEELEKVITEGSTSFVRSLNCISFLVLCSRGVIIVYFSFFIIRSSTRLLLYSFDTRYSNASFSLKKSVTWLANDRIRSVFSSVTIDILVSAFVTKSWLTFLEMMEIMFLESMKVSDSLFLKRSKRTPWMCGGIVIIESLVCGEASIFFLVAAK